MNERNKGAPRTASTHNGSSGLVWPLQWAGRIQQGTSMSDCECLMAHQARLSSYKTVEEGNTWRKGGGKSSLQLPGSFDFGGADYL